MPSVKASVVQRKKRIETTSSLPQKPSVTIPEPDSSTLNKRHVV